MSINHLELYALAERLHRQFLDVVQMEIDRLGYRDLNSVRAMILYNVGSEEMTASELMWRGCYLGSNVSYNLKKLTEAGYLDHVRSTHDKRVIMIKNSSLGLEVCARLHELSERHQLGISQVSLDDESLLNCARMLSTLQKYWHRALLPSRGDYIRSMAA